jgi:leucine dehydrogenase
MTYKAAITGLALGGGKSVIIGDNRTTERELLFRAHGRAIESLEGRYIAAEDVGTSVDDMEFVRMETDSVVGLRGSSGDPSPITAFGVYRGVKACAQFRYGDCSLRGKHVAVQGLGHVGYYLCKYLHSDGARLTVTDIDDGRVARVVQEFGAEAVGATDVLAVDADIFAPCALGGVINDDTLNHLQVDIVAGAANNQLSEARHGQVMHERGVVYAPDYVINAGGLCSVYGELHGWTAERTEKKAGAIYDTLLGIFERAANDGISTSDAADRLACQRIMRARGLE